jgi:hypothetical protein
MEASTTELQRKPASLLTPILLVCGALLFCVVATIASLGILAPIGLAVFCLSLFLSGFWLLLNRRSRASRIFAVLLIFHPVVLITLAFLPIRFG